MKSRTWRYDGDDIDIQNIVGWLDCYVKDHDWLGTFDSEREVITIDNFKPFNKAGAGDFTFCTKQGDEGAKAILDSMASYIICDIGLSTEPPLLDQIETMKGGYRRTLMFVPNPRLAFAMVLKEFFKPEPCEIRILGKANVDPTAALGMDGFGLERDEMGKWFEFPHFGDIMIGNDANIGAYVCVDRATLPGEYTEIGEGTKIDNFVHVAHNVSIGRHTAIVSHCNIGGSVVIGAGSYLAMSVTIKNKVKIGKRCILGNCANIRKDVPDCSVVVGDDRIIGHVDDKEEWRRLVGL